MLKPIGKKYSVNYYDVLLQNWARIYEVNIGCIGYEGINFGVGFGSTENLASFVVEGRGHRYC